MTFDEESIRKRIRALLEEIHTEADPELLNRYRSIFRQEVSFFRRSYMAAYLLLLEQNTKRPGQHRPEGRKRPFEALPPEGRSQDETPRVIIPEEESARLFISIGRNRKVFPREILGFINAKAQIARDDIGVIRILDNYSFVQVRNTVADAIIEALNGQNFRGRTLTVNYARARRDGEDTSEASGDTSRGEAHTSGGGDDNGSEENAE
jgi:hypothetical protein